ncbi:unnamed protein product [Urochloa humidicola]
MTTSCWDWEAVALDGELSAEVGALLASERRRRELSGLLRSRDEALRSKVRKHLVALGWSIVSKRNAAMAPRLQYRPPGYDEDRGGKTYCSLPDLIILAFAAASSGVDQQQVMNDKDDDDKALGGGHPTPSSSDNPGDDAIAEYVALMASGCPKIPGHLRSRARRQLEASGWSFWTKLKSDGREELRYKAPTTGRSYMSLHTACQAAMTANSHVGVGGTRKAKKRKISELLITSAVVKKRTTINNSNGTCSVIKKSTITTVRRSSKKKKKQQQQRATSRVVLRPKDDNDCGYWRSRTLLSSVLMDEGVLEPRDKVTCNRVVGLITGAGIIRCTCCGKAFTVAEFEAHAVGRTSNPWPRLFLKDGRSLSQCLVELMRRDDDASASWVTTSKMTRPTKVKGACLDPGGDSVCSICNDGGDLLLCDHCPSAFHHDCLGMQKPAAEDNWFCPCCRCAACGGTDFDPAAAGGGRLTLTDRSVIYCEQCEREYHVGCAGVDKQQLQQEPWVCSPGCEKVFRHLQGLAGKTIPTSTQGVSLAILRRRSLLQDQEQDNNQEEEEAHAHGQLRAALDLLHECFVPLVEPRTQTDLAADIVFNRESDLRRLRFRGYYVVGLHRGGELLTAATLRVYGDKVAELPLVGTRFAHRRQGMLRLLMTELETMLARDMGVRRLVLPAVPELLRMWTGPSFRFSPMSSSDKLDLAQHTILCFQGTTMCQKLLLPASQQQSN